MKRAWPLALALVAFALFAVLWIVSDRRAAQRVYDDYSTANTSPSGLSLGYAYLGKQRKVGILTRPFGREPLERNATVFRLADRLPIQFDPELVDDEQVGPPKPRFQPLLNDEAEAFGRAGGRVVIAVTQGVLPSGSVDEDVAQKVFPIWPAVQSIALQFNTGAYTSLPPRMHALFTAGDKIIAARERIGSGELYLLSTPEALRNSALSKNLALLEGLAGDGRPVYFDEVMHGITSGDGALELMKEWNLGPFLLLLGLTSLLIFWRAGKRIGAAEDEHRDTRSEAVDLVRSLGALYRDVTPENQALALYHDALTRTVAHSSGLRGDALHKRVEELTGGQRTLDAINNAFATAAAAGSSSAARGRRRN
ncbi:MAG TPA: hypothetical protein VE010_12450 [Thermoanaerobaculia bacterium]|nr:hypothetical protein [Thermoanaerobaculia bacterium]